MIRLWCKFSQHVFHIELQSSITCPMIRVFNIKYKSSASSLANFKNTVLFLIAYNSYLLPPEHKVLYLRTEAEVGLAFHHQANTFITSLAKGGYVFGSVGLSSCLAVVCLSSSLSICPFISLSDHQFDLRSICPTVCLVFNYLQSLVTVAV